MPTVVTTIEDTSPLIVYSGEGGYNDWKAGTSKDDSALDRYSQSSYTVTSTVNASASFFFYGTGVQIFGSKRPTHGDYQITVDAWVYDPKSGNATDAEGLFQTSLFTTSSLKSAYHMVRMTNVGNGLLDLDFLTWQTPIGQPDEELITRTVQDTDSSFRYSPEGAWNVTLPNQGTFAGGSGHQTTTLGATAELKFEVRDTVFIYGPVGPNGGTYSVQLDEQPIMNLTSYQTSYRPKTMLYQASNLGGGQHTVKVVSTSYSNSGRTLAIDYAEVFTVPSLQSSFTTGAIIGASIGSFFALVFLLLLALYLFKRLRNSKKYERLSQRQSMAIQDPYVYTPTSATMSNGHSMLSPSSPSQKSQVLHSQSSHSPMMFNLPSPLSTTWTPSTAEPFSPDPIDDNAISYPRDVKRDPEIRLAPAPASTSGIRYARSDASLVSLPPGARLPIPPGSEAITNPPSYRNPS
ncbi:hypothetical protein BJ165DRAFT_1402045 [Panaeolus papilionaceus]|nr:hypothetical protein BJ165DRAFT_1402045 [Panaeolus papilionaceus]